MRWVCLLGITFTLTACGEPPSARLLAADQLLRTYVGDLQVGERIRATREKHPALVLLPGVGYRDSTFQTADGFGDLVVIMEGMPGTVGLHPSPLARSIAMQVSSTAAPAAATVEAKLRAALGAPREGCRQVPVEGGQSRVLFWTDERGGVAFIVPVTWQVTVQNDRGETRVLPRSALLIFDSQDPSEFAAVLRRCPALTAGATPP